MNKAEIRPLLVEALEKAQKEEGITHRVAVTIQELGTDQHWGNLAKLQEAWAVARLRRAELELQLWLADRQWEREALEASQLEYMARQVASPTGKT